MQSKGHIGSGTTYAFPTPLLPDSSLANGDIDSSLNHILIASVYYITHFVRYSNVAE